MLTGNVTTSGTNVRGITTNDFNSTFTNTNLTFATSPTATYYSAASL